MTVHSTSSTSGDDDLDPTLLDRFWAGEASPDERYAVEAWFAAHPERRLWYGRLEHVIRDETWTDLSAPDVERVVAGVMEGIGAGAGASSASLSREPSLSPGDKHFRLPATANSRFHAVRGWGIALVGVVLAGVVVQGRLRTPAATAATKSYATAGGQQAIVTLPNGTQAVLGPSTTLRLNAVQADGGTTVTLEGEAVFTVGHASRAPFVVRTKNASTRVLGTTFFVRRYAADAGTRVVVTEGRVSLHPALAGSGTGAVLAASTLGVVDDSGNVRVTPNVPADDYLAWTTGNLVFHQTPVQEIVAELGRAYGANLRLTDSVLSQRAFTWSISVTRRTLADVLDVLTTALGAHVVQTGDVITIVPGSGVSRKSNSPRIPSTAEKQYGR